MWGVERDPESAVVLDACLKGLPGTCWSHCQQLVTQ
jgi:hypothetical protein